MGNTRIDIDKIKLINNPDSASSYLFTLAEQTPALSLALDYSTKAHLNQFRKSGEPYIVHPILVASIVLHVTESETMAIAALLHDTVEDTNVSIEDILNNFGEDVAFLVEGLTKIDTIRDAELVSSLDDKLIISALSFRKMLISSVKDVRVLIIKLCDRLHNMLTLDALSDSKQHKIAEETLVVYTPIAHRLGISFVKNILEDLSFSYIFKEENRYIENYFQDNYRLIENKLYEIEKSIKNILISNGICEDDFEVVSRIKHKYSIYLKMQRKGIGIDEVLDFLAIRILTKNTVDCYSILGLIHLNFKPLSSRFKDYIAIAKDNGYQTLHTTVFSNAHIFEIQIRTFDMHKTAELGIAAHWKYKNARDNIKLDWLNNLQYQTKTAEDLYELIKNDLYSEDISVFSPTGDIFTLPLGAVVLDYAYVVHTEIGDRAKFGYVNKMKVSLLKELRNGDIVRVETEDSTIIRCSWINAVKTNKAKTSMAQNCNNILKEIDSKMNISIVATAMGLKNTEVKKWIEDNCTEKIKNTTHTKEDYEKIIDKYMRFTGINIKFIRFLSKYRFKLKSYKRAGVEVFSVSGVPGVVFDYCCHPKNGDDILSFVEKDKVVIHHKLCSRAFDKINKNSKMLYVKWDSNDIYSYRSIISLHSKQGSLASFLTFLAKLNIDIVSIELGKENSEYIKHCELSFESKISDINKIRSHIEKVIKVIHLTHIDDAYKN